MTWHEYDGTAAEYEMSSLVASLVSMIKPALVVETGAYLGLTTRAIALALLDNKCGHLVTCEVNKEYAAQARQRLQYPVGLLHSIVEVRETPSLELYELTQADLVFLDSAYDIRPEEYRKVKAGATVVVHDTGDAAQQYSNDPARQFHLGRWCRDEGMLVWPGAGRGFAIGVKR